MMLKLLFCFLYILPLILSGCDSKEQENSFEYDLEQYQKTDPSLILYKEQEGIILSLNQVSGIAIDRQDNVYVAGDNSLLVFSPKGEKIAHKQLESNARCLAVDKDGTIYLAMKKNIDLYSSDFSSKKSWADLPENSLFTSLVISESNIFLADAANKIVLCFDKTGQLLHRIGNKDLSKGKEGLVIYQPHLDMVLGDPGKIWIVNPGKHRIENYDYQGNLLSFWGEPSFRVEGFCGCCNPSHLSMLSNGNFVTSEKNLLRIKIYTKEGKFLGVVAGVESFAGNTQPSDIAVNSKDQIFVLDARHKKIRIFQSR
ncbi:MAG: hypothetical protein HUU50_03485 [Candidatus Brocadiae bacterium]|nr:hypothetical protein [Candidatus Brocadiia bacterium]